MVKLLTIAWIFFSHLAAPFTGGQMGRCRFTPTCSVYALRAVKRYGIIQGAWMAIGRISRCHPGNPGGEDLI